MSPLPHNFEFICLLFIPMVLNHGRFCSPSTPWLPWKIFGKIDQAALVVKNLAANAGDIRDSGSIPGSGRSPWNGNSNLLHYSCLENPMDREAWQAMVHRVLKSQTQLKRHSMHACMHQHFWLSWLEWWVYDTGT